MPKPDALFIPTSALRINFTHCPSILGVITGGRVSRWAVCCLLPQNWEDEVAHSQIFAEIFSDVYLLGGLGICSQRERGMLGFL